MSTHTGNTGLLLAVMLLGTAQILSGQALAPRLTSWRPARWTEGAVRVAPVPRVASAETHSHTLTGLLIGGLVGAGATGLFLAVFCSDADTQCGADEVGRAVLIIAVPPAVLGAVIGSLIRTKR
jgi:hypothetical protein